MLVVCDASRSFRPYTNQPPRLLSPSHLSPQRVTQVIMDTTPYVFPRPLVVPPHPHSHPHPPTTSLAPAPSPPHWEYHATHLPDMPPTARTTASFYTMPSTVPRALPHGFTYPHPHPHPSPKVSVTLPRAPAPVALAPSVIWDGAMSPLELSPAKAGPRGLPTTPATTFGIGTTAMSSSPSLGSSWDVHMQSTVTTQPKHERDRKARAQAGRPPHRPPPLQLQAPQHGQQETCCQHPFPHTPGLNTSQTEHQTPTSSLQSSSSASSMSPPATIPVHTFARRNTLPDLRDMPRTAAEQRVMGAIASVGSPVHTHHSIGVRAPVPPLPRPHPKSIPPHSTTSDCYTAHHTHHAAQMSPRMSYHIAAAVPPQANFLPQLSVPNSAPASSDILPPMSPHAPAPGAPSQAHHALPPHHSCQAWYVHRLTCRLWLAYLLQPA